MYVRPRALGGPVGRPVLVGNGAARDVVMSSSGLLAFLGVRAVTGVTMSNTVSVGPAVAHRVRSPPPLGVVAAAPPSTATPGHGCKLVMEGLELVGEGEVGSGKRGVRGNELLKDGLLVGGSAGKVAQGIIDGVKEARVEGGGMGCVGLA